MKNNGLLKTKNCITKIFNIQQGDKNKCLEIVDNILASSSKPTKLLNELYKILERVPLLTNDSDFIANRRFNFQKNTIECLQGGSIKKGGSGLISQCLLNNETRIVKKPKYQSSNEVQLTIVSKQYADFLKEIIIHVLLYCFQHEMLDCFHHSRTIHKCIPEISSVFRAYSDNSKNENILMIMEKLDYTVNYFLEKHLTTEYLLELHLFAMIAYNIYFLQKAIRGFMHRDLHTDNVMIKLIQNSEKTLIEIPDYEINFEIETNYRTYLIDFGLSYIDFGESEKCKTKLKMPHANLFINKVYGDNKFMNRSHDLRLLLADVYYNCSKFISKEFYLLLASLFGKYDFEYKNSKSFQKYKRENNGHFMFYDELIDNEDKLFFPQNFLKIIQIEIQKLQANKSKTK